VKEDIAKSFREGDKVLMVHVDVNKVGRFLEVSMYVEGGRKGVLWLPEGQDRLGWRRFAGELRLMLAPPEGKSGSEEPVIHSSTSLKSLPTKFAEARVIADCSFTEVLQSTPRSELEGRSCVEVKDGEADQRIAEECERFLQAAGSERKIRGSAVKGWVNHLLVFVQLVLGWVVAGLLEGLLNRPEGISAHKQVKVVLKSLDGPKGFRLGPSFLPTSTGRVNGLRKVQASLTVVGVGFPLKSKRETRLKPSCRDRPLAYENTSL
jgi:hypothetical protein